MEMFYADETGFEEHYSRTCGYSQRSKRVHGAVPGTRRHRRVSIIGVINQNNVFLAGFAFKGYMNSDLFTGWLEYVFAPSLKNSTKSIIIIDNASHHPKKRIYDIAEKYGFFVIFLPKYSLDLNKIEKYWANIKNWLHLHLEKCDSFSSALVRAFRCR